jgi:predicted transcriptional regulator/energy-coupling factor transporter ATP-binding protein EcfA2
LLVYNNCELKIEVWGGIKITGLERMKVTLKITRLNPPLGAGGLPVRHSFDLYHRQQTEQLIQSVSDGFDMNVKQVETTVAQLTQELENYRLQKLEAMQPKQESKPLMNEAAKQTAIAELKRPNLLKRTNEMIGLAGIVGEDSSRLIAYLVYTMRKQPVPLHVMFLGSSGSGKTYLQEKVSGLIPDEDKIEITQITENALYYFKQHELQNKLILIEDLDGAMAVFYPLRELQTKRRITKTVTLKDSKGNLKTITLTVEGPVCVSGCTTKEKIYDDNANRCILLYIDQGKEQDKHINEYQAKLAAGEVNKEREQQYKELFKNMQRLLRPIQVVNPYARHIQLPEQVFKPRRTMTLLLGFIEAITFYHQYQREVRQGAGGLYIETTIEDIEAAFALLKDVLFSKSDELTKAARDFLEKLKQLSQEANTDTFNARAIREQLRLNPGSMKRHLAELARYGYIRPSGNRYRKGSYEYTIVNLNEYEALKSSVEQHLQNILQAIKSHIEKQGQ